MPRPICGNLREQRLALLSAPLPDYAHLANPAQVVVHAVGVVLVIAVSVENVEQPSVAWVCGYYFRRLRLDLYVVQPPGLCPAICYAPVVVVRCLQVAQVYYVYADKAEYELEHIQVLPLVRLNGIAEQRPQLFSRQRPLGRCLWAYLQFAERVECRYFIVYRVVEHGAYVAKVDLFAC